MTTILAMTLPGAVVLITLFGLLARGNPKPVPDVLLVKPPEAW